ncbi:hypothetical protein C0J52_15354 [Blattella germanica]|nr:hypothetical protein C0J52_15354 [Blattella germanica]
MNCHCGFVIFIICICALDSTISSVSGVCSTNVMKTGCTDPNESCFVQKNSTTGEGVCRCNDGYIKLDNGLCFLIATTTTSNPKGGDTQPVTPAPSDTSSVSVTAAALVYSARRYQWLHRLYLLRQRRYDEVRIGQEDDDDPPIA